MSLVTEQDAFLRDLCKLLTTAWGMGYTVTGGELSRSIEQQQIHVQAGRSKTMNSMHLKRCAADLNIFKDGALCNREQVKPLGDYWKSLSGKNRWGGDFTTLVDTPHFERVV